MPFNTFYSNFNRAGEIIMMEKGICVYCSSSDAVGEKYVAAAQALGKLIGDKRYRLIYGGATVGLMGAVAQAVLDAGGRVTGIIPEKLQFLENGAVDELIVSKDLRDRKHEMETRSDAFIALPGGFGTLEEVLEILTLKQLNYHDKPIVFIDTDGFYSDLKGMFQRIYNDRFTKKQYQEFYHFVSDPEEAMSYIENYTPPEFVKKWF